MKRRTTTWSERYGEAIAVTIGVAVTGYALVVLGIVIAATGGCAL